MAWWEELNRKRGANLVNAYPREPEQIQQPNVNIVTKRGNHTGANKDTLEQPIITNVSSPKGKYDPHQ